MVLDGWIDGWMGGWVDGRMDGWIDGWMVEPVYGLLTAYSNQKLME